MKTYIKFLVINFIKSFINLIAIFSGLILIINLLSELDFFKEIQVDFFFPIYLALLNIPSLLFEMFPFLILISTQFFFLNLFNQDEIQIFKYSGLKNSKILIIISLTSFIIGIFSILLFYNFSSDLKKFYLELKSQYTTDNKYLAVITKNGIWIKDSVNDKKILINSSKIEKNFLYNTLISEFDEEYDVIKNIYSDKIDIKNQEWKIFNPKIIKNNSIVSDYDLITYKTNFDYSKIQSLFSNLMSLNILELLELRKNYISINYSTVEIDIQIQKLISYPIYLVLICVFAAIIMFNSKKFKNNLYKIVLGLLSAVVIYYLNNFFNVLGKTEKMHYIFAIWTPMLILFMLNIFLTKNINEK